MAAPRKTHYRADKPAYESGNLLDLLDGLSKTSADQKPPAAFWPQTAPGFAQIELADAITCYPTWPAPTVIVSDGAYGVAGFPGDPPTPDGLAEWYEPHIAAWAHYALPATTLWFWGTEIGWATVHPVMARYGWEYRGLHIWDKSVAHVAGNVNSKTIRRFPIVTEVCAQYVRSVELPTHDGRHLPIRDWLRYEWHRTGLPFSKTNEACGVKNAATRKYRNWPWQYKKKDRGSNNTITLSTITHHYPSKADMIADVPKSDNGGNFGRFARTSLMDEYIFDGCG